MASKEKGISSGQWYISVVPLDQIIVQVVISFSKDALNGLPLREHIVNRSRHLTFGKQVRLTLYPEQFPFYFAEYLRRIPFPVPEVIFVCPSLSTNTVFMFFLIQLVRQLNQRWLFLLNFTVITVDKTVDAKRAALLDRDSHSVRESDGNPVKHIRRGGRGRADRKQTAERGCRLFSGGDGRGGTQLTDTDAVTGKPKTHTMVVYMSFTAITTKS